MRYQIRYEPNVIKQLKRIPNKDVVRINEAINRLAYNPFIGKKLKDDLVSFYSLRIWPYRVIYKIHRSFLMIIVVRITHRQNAYKD